MATNSTKKKSNWFQRFLLFFVIPFTLLLTITLIVLTLLGVNVFQTAKQYTEQILFMPTTASTEQQQEESREQIIDLQEIIDNQKAEIANLTNKMSEIQQEVEDLEDENSNYKYRLEMKEEAEMDAEKSLKDIVKTYETMSAKSAAAVLSEMQEVDAFPILATMKSDERAAIFAKMDPETAAKFTKLLTYGSSDVSSTADIAE
ncbi:MotE family protein [Cytobacillus sp. Hm23]